LGNSHIKLLQVDLLVF